MKKIKILFCLIILLVLCFNICAQTADEDEKIYVKNFTIAKIYITPYGYQIRYWTTGTDFYDIYIPLEWFSVDPKKAFIIYDNNPAYPYFTVLWKDGKFDYIKIFARRNKKHMTWGSKRPSSTLKQKFTGVEDLTLEY